MLLALTFSFRLTPSTFYRIKSGKYASLKESVMEPDLRRLEDISGIRDAMRQISQEASVAVDLLDAKIEDERLDGRTEAEEIRTILELIQNLSLEVSEKLDAYQGRYAG
jgi:predicted transcriptional regulator